MKRHLISFSALILILSLVTPSLAQRRRRAPRPRPATDNGCQLPFTGSDRRAVKLRRPNLDVPFHNGGRAISLVDWYEFVCPLSTDVPTRRRDVPQGRPLNVERLKVKVRAFVLAIKQESNDNDLHLQIADTASPYNQQQLVVEIPPGDAFCTARSNMMELFRADGGRRLSTGHVFRNPPLVEITGYLFLDSAHMRARRTDVCTDNGGRGIRNGLRTSPVRGIWEIHPVTELIPIARQ